MRKLCYCFIIRLKRIKMMDLLDCWYFDCYTKGGNCDWMKFSNGKY